MFEDKENLNILIVVNLVSSIYHIGELQQQSPSLL